MVRLRDELAQMRAAAIVIQRVMVKLIHKKKREQYKLINQNFKWFAKVRQEMVLSSQILIAYHWRRYRKRKATKK